MAKKAMIERDKRRARLIEQFAAKRAELKGIISNPETSDEDFYAAVRKLSQLPRDSSPVRLRHRCSITGRPRAFIRKYGVSRITFRELASSGKIPGVTKSSW